MLNEISKLLNTKKPYAYCMQYNSFIHFLFLCYISKGDF